MNTVKASLIIILFTGFFTGGVWAEEDPLSPHATEAQNRAVVLRYMQEFINGRDLDALDEIMVADWIAHNPLEPNGREALKELATGWFQQFPDMHADVKRLFADGDFVITQSHYTFNAEHRGNDRAPAPSGAAADIFRLENGKIVEHWDVVQRQIPENSLNGNTMFDGSGVYNYRSGGVQAEEDPLSSHATEAQNRAAVLRYMQEFINGRDLDVLDEIMVADWIAHNPLEPNGREALKELATGWFQQFPEMHADVKRLFADGDFVITQSHYTFNAEHRGNDRAPAPSGAAADIFRLENGKIVEHWDVVQRQIPENSLNGNTMFDGSGVYNYR